MCIRDRTATAHIPTQTSEYQLIQRSSKAFFFQELSETEKQAKFKIVIKLAGL